MKPILYSSAETDFSSNGIGRLSDAASCIVTEAINGEFEMEISYPSDGKHAESVIEGAIIMSSFDESGDLQPFRVYQRTDVIDGVFTVRARHLAYDLARIPVMPFSIENATPTSALAGIKNNTVVSCPFTFATDMVGTAAFGLEVPTSAKAALGGGAGSVIGVFGGEAKYNRWEVSVLSRRGQNKPVTIRYGKNMTGLECISNAAMAYNAVVPYCKTQDGVITTTPPVVAHGTYTCAVPLNLSDAFDGYVPSAQQLENAAVAWLNEHQPWVTEKAITVHFVELWQTEEYKNVEPLQFVQLGDGVTVSYPKLGVDAVFRVVKTVFDVLQNRYSEIVLGRETATASTMISELITKLEEARDIAQEIANGTYTGGTFINGQLIYAPEIYGGEIYIGAKPGGGYNFNVDSSGNIETAGTMTAVGHYAIKRENGSTSGYMGRAKGYDGHDSTFGVALCASDTTPDDLNDSTNCYIIVTNSGVRMQAKGNSLWVGSGGAFWGADMLATRGWVEGVADDVYQAACEYADSLLGGANGE